MRVLRSRAAVLVSLLLAWQILMVMVVSTALCCRPDAASEAASCPMHHESGEACPMHHPPPLGGENDCLRVGCSQSDSALLATFGPMGVLPVPVSISQPVSSFEVIAPSVVNLHSLSATPLAPPPRS